MEKFNNLFCFDSEMKRRAWKYFGVLLIVAGFILLLNSFSGITGFVVFEGVSSRVGGIVGIVLVLGGVGILVSIETRNRKVLQEIDDSLRSGRIGTYREAERIARKLGYSIAEGKNHMTVYDDEHRVVTQIPRHSGNAPTGLYRVLLKKFREHAA